MAHCVLRCAVFVAPAWGAVPSTTARPAAGMRSASREDGSEAQGQDSVSAPRSAAVFRSFFMKVDFPQPGPPFRMMSFLIRRSE